jgi:hypothetical protein
MIDQSEQFLHEQQQWLVRFENKTQVLNLPPTTAANEESWKQSLLRQWSETTGWPVTSLEIQSIANPFISLRVVSCLRGGKGGFGTLLKGQSRQAGAKLTTDFGACRDLQGRRLRHVNDEIKLRKWREAQQIREQGGDDKEATAAMFDTPSGLYNWHLMVPSWADISKKSSRKIQRQFRSMQREEDKVEQAKKEKRAQYDRSVTLYVNRATDAAKEAQGNIKSAVKQGLLAQKEKKRKRLEEEVESPADIIHKEDRPNSLCTLSGDVVVEETKKDGKEQVYQIQSQSDFATLALFLDKAMEPTKSKASAVLYYEVKIVTGGLAQVGWADVTSEGFHPNTEEGEGVGDDKGSYGYDGSRGLKFHGGEDEVYDNSQWKAGDIVGCQYNVHTAEISYSLNGKDLGVAFSAPDAGTILFPALSSNGGEILELHIGPQDMVHLPKSSSMLKFIPVQDLVAASIAEPGEKDSEDDDDDQKPRAAEKSDDEAAVPSPDAEGKKEEQVKESKKEPVKAEPLDLGEFVSIEELEKLGLDRLKGALIAIGVKCG